jgi:hypothetical protein
MINTNRFDLRTISQHFGQIVVGIYETYEEAVEAMDLKMKSQDLPMVIYDSTTDTPVKLRNTK